MSKIIRAYYLSPKYCVITVVIGLIGLMYCSLVDIVVDPYVQVLL